jgi:EmrB/QacA subfamily drug resistance transporter
VADAAEQAELPAPTRAQRFTLLAAILGSTVVFLDSTVVNVALPAIADDLHAGLASQQWVVEAYMLTLVALLLTGGALGDQHGRRLVFLAGLVGFAVTSVACAVAPTDETLIAARALQGVAGALLVPGSLALVAAAYNGPARGRAIGTWTAWTGIATVLGPAAGGALVDALSWRWIFWINLPLIAATVWIVLAGVRESRDEQASSAVDWPGIMLSAVGLGGVVLALIEQPERGWGDPLVWGSLLVGVACIVAFLTWESRSARAMLELSLFRVRNFSVTNAVTLLVYAGLIGGTFYIAIFLQQASGYSALEAGLATMPASLLLFALSPRFGRLSAELGPRLLMCVGPILAGGGMLLLVRVEAEAQYLTQVLPAVLLFGLGLAVTVAPLTTTVLESVGERHAGIASGINNGVSRVAGLLAIAVLGAVIASTYAARLDDELSGAPLTDRARAEAGELRERALARPRSEGLRPEQARVLDTAAADAAAAGFHAGSALAGALMIAGGILAGAGIRNPPRRRE